MRGVGNAIWASPIGHFLPGALRGGSVVRWSDARKETMTIAIELREHDALRADRDDWASSAGALLEVVASYKTALDNSTTELANMTARAEYWESAANRALGELQVLQVRFRAEYGLPIARWGDGPLVSAAAPDGQPGCVLVAPGRLSDGTCLY